MIIKKLEVPNYDIHGRRTRGKREIVQILATPNPFQKKQTVKVTVTLPRDPSGPMLQPIRKESTVYYNTDLMEALQKAQARWPGRPISIQTLDLGKKLEKQV